MIRFSVILILILIITGCSPKPVRIIALADFAENTPWFNSAPTEEERISIIKTVFQQRMQLSLINSALIKNPISKDNGETYDFQSLLLNTPVNSCEIIAYVQKIDTLENRTFSDLNFDLAAYDFYKVTPIIEKGRFQYFCELERGGTNFLQLNDSIKQKPLNKNYLVAVNHNSHIYYYSNDDLIPEILFLSDDFLEFEKSKYYLNYIIFPGKDRSIDRFTKWLGILAYSEYNPRDITYIKESKKYHHYRFYSLDLNKSIECKILKTYPNTITYVQ